MINLTNNHARTDYLVLSEEDYWDYTLIPDHGSVECGGLDPIAYIDFSENGCFDGEYVVKSCDGYVWPESVSGDYFLEHHGMTGIDRGVPKFDKMSITDKEFEELFAGGKGRLMVPEGKSLTLSAVNGNTEIYDYSLWRENAECYGFCGGFFQGFFKTEDCKYQVLPDSLEAYDWNLEFRLKPHDFSYDSLTTLNDTHPGNKGIFFYIGTRAENKFWRYYRQDAEELEASGVITENTNTGVTFWETLMSSDGKWAMLGRDKYVLARLKETYEYDEEKADYEKDMKQIAEEYGISLDNVKSIETDNKFIFYDRTRSGMTVFSHDEGKKYVFKVHSHEFDGNPFLLFDRTRSGLAASKVEYLEMKEGRNATMKPYKLCGDLYNNALAFQVRDDGSVGFKYLVRDCDGGIYKITEGFTKPGMVVKDEWSVVNVKMISVSASLMKIYIYVNGYLKYVSEELEKLRLRALNDDYSKQEGVPFCISVGGGTQGLCDVIYPDYKAPPKYVFPLEREFAGTFDGYISSFKFREGLVPYKLIRRFGKA